ncbi:hypothetical protein GX586_00595 [bacterium]|nr:hypothetical protein [bacterium]
MATSKRNYNAPYTGEQLNYISFPLGGIGAGMVCLEGNGALGSVSVRNKPSINYSPMLFSALCVKGRSNEARVLEGPVPEGRWRRDFGGGTRGRSYGLPRCARASFKTHFPFATVSLADPDIPLQIEVTGWSPFIPLDADNSSLPVAGLEYRFRNKGRKRVDAVYSFHAENFMRIGRDASKPEAPPANAVRSADNGFVLWQDGSPQEPWNQGGFCASVLAPGARVNCAWFRGVWFDPLTLVWRDIASGASPAKPPLTDGAPSPGGSVAVPFSLKPGEEITIPLLLAWHVPHSNVNNLQKDCNGKECTWGLEQTTYQPWYAGRFADIIAVTSYWRSNYARLRGASLAFAECFYDTNLPPEVIEAVAANLTILKSPTVLRQLDGRAWAWEGCNDEWGCCHGSCTHVWNYAQALPHLFPALERTFRQTEFHEDQDDRGHQQFRADLPIHPQADHHWHAAADGQLGGIIKMYREWRISGDTEWLRGMWPRVKRSLDYCIDAWDPEHEGVLKEPHHNTYDIEFWGPDGMHMTFYLGALKAAQLMAEALGDSVPVYAGLFEKGRKYLESKLFNGEFFVQNITWKGLRAGDPTTAETFHPGYSAEARLLLEKEGPKYQYGSGCLSDGVLGAWLAAVAGMPPFLDEKKITRHLKAVYKHNFKRDLSRHANPQRPQYAMGTEGGLLLCTWPRGGALTLPFPYSNEVWTGIEYQVASHLMLAGCVKEGLDIVRVCRDRYDGRTRNPFDEIECGHWYARAMSSYALLRGMTGVRYDAVDKTLWIEPRVKGDFRAFICTATGYGTAGVKNGKPFLKVRHGVIEVNKTVYRPAK